MDLSQIGAWAGEYGPMIAIIIILARSNLKKDETIEKLSAQAMRMAEVNSNVVEQVTP